MPRRNLKRSMKPTVSSPISDKRARYDRFGKEGLGSMGGGFHDYTVDFGDIFEELFGGFGFSTGRRSSRRSPRRGRDLQMQVNLTFEEAVFGVEKDIEFDREETCSHCGGSGAEPGTSPVENAPPVMDRVKSARSARPSSVRWYKPQPVLFVMAVARRSQGPAKPVMAAGWNVRRSERKCKFLPVWMRALRSVSPGREVRAPLAVPMEVSSSCWMSVLTSFSNAVRTILF